MNPFSSLNNSSSFRLANEIKHKNPIFKYFGGNVAIRNLSLKGKKVCKASSFSLRKNIAAETRLSPLYSAL